MTTIMAFIKRHPVQTVLLACGIVSPLLYVATDVLGNLLYEGYSYTDNTWSELFAIGAPTRSLLLPLIVLGVPLMAAFAVGVWTSAGRKRAARITAATLLGYTVFGTAAQVFFPMLTREALAAGEAALPNALHPPVTMVSVLFLLLAVGFGATLLGKRFRHYSYGTILMLVVFGVLSGLQGGQAEANLPTPWIGLEQRINAYAFALWVAVLAIGLLHARTERSSRPHPLALQIIALAALVMLATFFLHHRQAQQRPVSAFGTYRGYAQAHYDGTRRFSDYVTLADGTQLAYDLILPTKRGVVAQPLPVLFAYTPYLRTFRVYDAHGNNLIAELLGLSWKERAMLRVRSWLYDRGHLMDPLFRTRWLERLVKHGYAAVVVERPGTGASFGTLNPSFEVGAQEADELLNWIAAQAWCDGNIGMFGDSWGAQIQFAVAGRGNPHLKAIFPASSSLDNYGAVIYPGGVYNRRFAEFFTWSTTFLESEVITPIDRDRDGTLLAQARAERANVTVGAKSAVVMRHYPFRDSLDSSGRRIWEETFALYPFTTRINHFGVPVYMTNGWYDLFTRDMFLMYANLSGPRRLVVRPLDHSQIGGAQYDLDYAAEAHRWFDFWLKGIDTGVMDEAPIHYYLMGAPKEDAWRTAQAWPPAGFQPTRFYFAEGRTGSVASVNDGFLQTAAPETSVADDRYTVDYGTTSGKASRWGAVNWPHRYPDLRANDARALTYTTAPLEAALELVGHPVVRVWLSTSVPDLDVFAYLEAVGPRGDSTYLTEGNLRASHRTLSEAPFDTLGLPWHSHFRGDVQTVPAGEPVAVAFDLLPTAYRFRKGQRIRVTIAFADADNFETPTLEPAPTLHLLRDRDHPSYVELPIQQLGRNAARAEQLFADQP
jgi:uncharacterized protein